MKHNAIDIILICIIVVLVLACVAAGVLGYYTHGWTMWDLSEESTVRIIEDDSISVEMDEDQQQGNTAVALEAGEGYAVTSAENDGYIEKAFVPLYCWPSKFDMWKDIEWSISYSTINSEEKLTMRLDETRPNLVWLECTGAFFGVGTVTATVGDISATCGVHYEPVYLGLGVGRLVDTAAPSFRSPIIESWAPSIDDVCTLYYGTSAFKGQKHTHYNWSMSQNIPVGLLNHFGEIELITREHKSVWQDCTVTMPDLPTAINATLSWWHGAPISEFGDDFPESDGSFYWLFHRRIPRPYTDQEEYDIIKKYASQHDTYTVDLMDPSSFPTDIALSASMNVFEDFTWKQDWDPDRDIIYSSTSAPTETSTPCRLNLYGYLTGDYWHNDTDHRYGISAAHANGRFPNGRWVTTPFFYVGFECSFTNLASVIHNGSNCEAYFFDITDCDPIVVSITYGEYTLDIVFDFSKAEELV